MTMQGSINKAFRMHVLCSIEIGIVKSRTHGQICRVKFVHTLRLSILTHGHTKRNRRQSEYYHQVAARYDTNYHIVNFYVSQRSYRCNRFGLR